MVAFEQEFAEHVGGQVEAVAVNSATAGLHLALEACGVGPGDEVIVPTWTFTATAEVVRYVGATPVLVDVDPVTLNIDLPRRRGCPHAGDQGRHPRPSRWAGGRPEGAAGDRGSERPDHRGRRPRAAHGHRAALRSGDCQHSDAAVFSFYATKTITTGEGGMITTRDPAIAARARVMRLHGIDRDAFDRYRSDKPAWFYDVVAAGFKYNMTDPAAAMGRVQLSRSAQMHARRQRTR